MISRETVLAPDASAHHSNGGPVPSPLRRNLKQLVQSRLPVRDASSLAPCSGCSIRSRSVCAGIETGDLHQLALMATVHNVRKRQIFIREGEAVANYFAIRRGTVKLFAMLPDGRQQVIGFARSGQFVGWAETGNYAFSAEAIDQAQVCQFPRRMFRALMDEMPSLERKLHERARIDLSAAQEQILLLGRRSACERVAMFLLASERAMAPPTQQLTRIPLPMTRKDLADYLGLTTETVSRTLSVLRASKRIAIPSAREIVIKDRRWMQDTAGGVT